MSRFCHPGRIYYGILVLVALAGLPGCAPTVMVSSRTAARRSHSLLRPEEYAALSRAWAEAMQFKQEYYQFPDHGREWNRMLAQLEWATARHRPYPHLIHGPASRRWVSLTFDDGPDPRTTPLVLDVLHATRVPATFFLIGRNAERHPNLVRRIVAEGHVLGNHSYHHIYLTRISPENARTELAACSKVIRLITGRSPRYYRPPGGHFDDSLVETGRQLGMRLVDWTDTLGDWQSPSPSLLLRHALGMLRPGGIMLWHDDIPVTAEVLLAFIQEARARGYRFVPLRAFERPAQDRRLDRPAPVRATVPFTRRAPRPPST
ncbi:MAG: polysaccharide deacetylase family protein [Armatimonadetes bacterium]|nr:polysaccharide deacetylase family protein [Armatimonadota bacterium]